MSAKFENDPPPPPRIIDLRIISSSSSDDPNTSSLGSSETDREETIALEWSAPGDDFDRGRGEIIHSQKNNYFFLSLSLNNWFLIALSFIRIHLGGGVGILNGGRGKRKNHSKIPETCLR